MFVSRTAFYSVASLGIALLLLVSTATANAMSVEPMVLDMVTSGGNAKSSFKVSNDSSSPLPVEISVSRMEISVDGDPKYTPAANDFLIFPPQANIPKGGSQTFRVQWIGEPQLAASQAYRMSVAQLPLKSASGQSGIQVTMSFGIVVSVSPPQAKATVSILKVRGDKDSAGKRAVSLNVKNTGNKQAYMSKAALRLSGGNWSKQLTPYEVSQKVGLGIIQPGKERRFLLPIDVPGNVSDITASIDYQPNE
jgi:fimbrial chaperone protein